MHVSAKEYRTQQLADTSQVNGVWVWEAHLYVVKISGSVQRGADK
jgi:hypothetical protein